MIRLLLVLLLAAGLYALWRAQRRRPLLQLVFLARFPLLLAALLAALAPLALWVLPSLLRNLLSMQPSGILLVTLLALFAAWVVMITLGIIVRRAPARFGLQPVTVPAWVMRHRAMLAALLALPLVTASVALSPGGWAERLAAAAAGAALAFALLLGCAALVARFSGSLEGSADLLVSGGSPLLQRLAGPAVEARGERPADAGSNGDGYRQPGTGQLAPGHLLATGFFTLTALTYGLAFLLIDPATTELPSLAFLLLILILVGWALPGASFFLDRFRVPTSLVALAVSFLGSWLFATDHYYTITPLGAGAAPAVVAGAASPEQVFAAAERRYPQPQRPVVVVAASGGGITASLWTAKVLSALQQELGDDFARSIRLISSVSGGSVGTLYYLDRFTEQGPPPAADLPGLLTAAGASSLSATAWGLAYPDLWRGLFGYPVGGVTRDRGWAMEQAWATRLEHPARTLGTWRRGMSRGWLPAAVLNATVVESGDQFLLTGLERPLGWQAEDFLTDYPQHDVAAVTAARLSATFPWVTPISRARLAGGPPAVPGLHLGDGGYFDNFGVVSAINWFDSLGEQQRREIVRRGVLLVLVRAFASRDDGAGGAPAAGGGLAPGDDRGWLYATVGPVIALLNVRSSTQEFRDSLGVSKLEELWSLTGVEHQVAHFVLRADAPLSWKLTDRQRQEIVDGWDETRNRQALAAARTFFERRPAVPVPAEQAPADEPHQPDAADAG